MNEGMKLGGGPEFNRIREMIAATGHSVAHIGDDAAILDIPNADKLVVSIDTSVENVHFKREWMTFEEIGYRATAAALSDLAAMGASPIGVVVAYGVPAADSNALVDLARGAGAAALASGTFVVGGDISSSQTITITATVLGSSSRPLLRDAARDGDLVYLTGSLGGSKLALDAFKAGAYPPSGARQKFMKPAPRIQEALWLAGRGAHACIDVSDGLSGDLQHIAAASGVELYVETQCIPLFEGSSSDCAITSGEEYELCVTAPQEIDTHEFFTRFKIPLTRIGKVLASQNARVNFGTGAGVKARDSFNHFVNVDQ